MLWMYSAAPVVDVQRSPCCHVRQHPVSQGDFRLLHPDCRINKAQTIYILSSTPCTCDTMPAPLYASDVTQTTAVLVSPLETTGSRAAV